jgi:antibiotic biosynthesis monooxygenase (ABM) superfamily enzyme
MVDQPHDRTPRWLAPLVTTLAAWLAAYLIVTALLTIFGEQLGSLPLALRALVISGVLVALMANVVMPVLSVAVARWVAGRSKPRVRRGRMTAGRRSESRA